MTVKMTQKQLAALSVTLARYGLVVKPAPKPRKARNDYLARIKAWKPETAAGRACKAGMLRYAALPPMRGAYDFRYGPLPQTNDPAQIAAYYASLA
jgi:hypothetical protein